MLASSAPIPRTPVGPQWIAKMYPGKTGRDHLGLGSVSSDQILPSLAPGINVLTQHPRYHSFYVFLLDEFWRRDRPRTRREWIQFFRPRECIFSIGANLCDQPEHGKMPTIVGARSTASWAGERRSQYDSAASYIDSPLGGYGLYYRSVMAQLDLVYPGGPGFPYPVDVPTEKGKTVAEAFRASVAATVYYRDYFDNDKARVPIAVIQEYIRQACLCRLQSPTAHDHSLLLDHFLHAGSDAESRRASLRMMLDIAEQTQDHPLEQDRFRQLIYFGASESGASSDPIEEVKATHGKWRLYQAREYYALALNALWWRVSQS